MIVILSLSDRKPVDIADEIVVMVVPDYQMLANVEKIAAALSDDPVKIQSFHLVLKSLLPKFFLILWYSTAKIGGLQSYNEAT